MPTAEEVSVCVREREIERERDRERFRLTWCGQQPFLPLSLCHTTTGYCWWLYNVGHNTRNHMNLWSTHTHHHTHGPGVVAMRSWISEIAFAVHLDLVVFAVDSVVVVVVVFFSRALPAVPSEWPLELLNSPLPEVGGLTSRRNEELPPSTPTHPPTPTHTHTHTHTRNSSN